VVLYSVVGHEAEFMPYSIRVEPLRSLSQDSGILAWPEWPDGELRAVVRQIVDAAAKCVGCLSRPFGMREAGTPSAFAASRPSHGAPHPGLTIATDVRCEFPVDARRLDRRGQPSQSHRRCDCLCSWASSAGQGEPWAMRVARFQEDTIIRLADVSIGICS
jgi:hypothetical protein